MAVKRYPEDRGDFSDESDFYGDDDTRMGLEWRALQSRKAGYVLPIPLSAFKRTKMTTNPNDGKEPRCESKAEEDVEDFLKPRPQVAKLQKSYWQSKEPTKKEPTRTVDDQETKDLVEVNFFKDHPTGWQQSEETVQEFLRRLPVADPMTAQLGDWLWVGAVKIPWKHLNRRKADDVSAFAAGGSALLEAFNQRRLQLESEYPTKDAATITRKLAPDRDKLEIDLLTFAVKTGTTCGKWMLFPNREDLPRAWRTVAVATSEGKLGHNSKVATYDASDNQTLICIHTYDFSDIEDVRRVLSGLVDLDLCSTTGKPIYYKCDAYTYLGINSTNAYRLRASLYSSKEILQNEAKALNDGPVARLKKRNKTMDEFFHLIIDEDIT